MTRPEALSRQSMPHFKAQAQMELVKALGLAGKIDEARGVIEAINVLTIKHRLRLNWLRHWH